MRPLPTTRTRRSTTAGKGGAIKASFTRMMAGLAAEHDEEKPVMIEATYFKVHRTATSLGVKKGAVDALSVEQMAA